MKDFWGGYQIEFKVIDVIKARGNETNPEWLRRNAFAVGPKNSTKFTVDISCHEYRSQLVSFLLDDYAVNAYSLELILCEKLRAICQQLPEYGPVIKRNREGSARPRDFVDICSIMEFQQIDVTLPEFQMHLSSVFAAKRVPLSFIGLIPDSREFHRQGFPSVLATLAESIAKREFDFYFDEVLILCRRLKPLWDVQSPA
jgi:hypothetical protein